MKSGGMAFLFFAAIFAIAIPFGCPAQILKSNNNVSLDQAGSWVPDVAPNSGNVAIWDATVATAANCTNTIAAAVSWGGIQISNPVVSVKILTNNSPTISLGSSGINMSNATVNLWIAPAVTTVSDQNWTITNGLTLMLGEAGQNVTIANNVAIAGSVLFPSSIAVNSGGSLIVPSGASVTSTITNNGVTSIIVNGTVVQTGGAVTVGRSDSNSGSPKATVVIGSSSAGIYDLSGGFLTDGSTTSDGRIDVGTGAGAAGTLNVSGGAVLQLQALYVANGGNGTVNLTNSTLTVADNFRVGVSAGTGTMNVYGGTLQSVSTLNLPNGAGTGFLNVNGGTVNVNAINVANSSGGSGTGTLTVNAGVLVVTNSIALAPSSGNGTLNLNGGTAVASAVSHAGSGVATLNWNGGALKPRAANAAFLAGGVVADVLGGGAVLDTTNFNVTIGCPLLNGTGGAADGGLAKYGGGTLTLAGANGTYNGPTLINAGTLALTAADTITNSVDIVIGSGARLDVSGLASPLALGSGQALTGGGATGTVNGNLNLGAGSLAVNYTNGTPVLTVTSGALVLANNAVAVTVVGAALPVGSYQLISPGSGGSVGGSVSSSLLTVNGSGAVAGSTASSQITAGGLYLVVAAGGGISTATTLKSSINPSIYGEAVTLTAAVNPAPTNGEIVTFEDGTALLGTNPLSGGVATLTTSALTAGSHSLTAAYGGDGLYVSSSGPLTQTVQPSLTSIGMTGSRSVVLQGSAGISNGTYYVLSSTNLALPLTNWTMIGAAQWLDANGNFSLTNVNVLEPAWPAQFFAVSLSPQILSAQDAIVLTALQNMRDDGFNIYLPVPGGLYINWVYTNDPPVATNLVNIETDGLADASPTERHDELTDLEFGAAMCLYKQLHPLDTQFDATLELYTNILEDPDDDNYLGDPSEDGWTYFAQLDIERIFPAWSAVVNAYGDKYYHTYTENLGKYPGVTPLYMDFPTNAPTGQYTVAREIEDACVLIVNGTARGLTNYVAAGEALLAFQRANAWGTNVMLWCENMGGVFTDSSRTQIAQPSAEYIYDPSIKPGEIGEVCEALIWAEHAAPGHGYGAWALQALDNLQPSVNAYGLWDGTYGGYWAQDTFNTNSSQMNINSPGLTYTLDNGYKEVGRFTVVERAFLAANATGLASYSSNLLAQVNQAALASYYHAGHGWPYQENGNWTLFNDPPLQTWVTSEAIGHAVRSILSYELAQ